MDTDRNHLDHGQSQLDDQLNRIGSGTRTTGHWKMAIYVPEGKGERKVKCIVADANTMEGEIVGKEDGYYIHILPGRAGENSVA